MERASRRFWNPLKCRISTWQGRGKGRWQSAGKGLKLRRRVLGPGGTCFAQVLKPSKCRISTWQGRGKGRKVHRRVSCPCETCLVQMQYSTWQSVGKGLKLHGGFWGPGGTCFAQVLKPSTCSISTWQGKGKGRWQSAGKGLKLHGRVWGPEVLKPSKSSISTWQSSSKRRKVHRRVSCPSETCLAQVWKPSKCNIRPGKALAKG